MTDTTDARREAGTEATPPAPQAVIEPHGWALSAPARLYRRLARHWTVDNHVRKLCQPFTLEGTENLSDMENPTIIIANHTSHFDTAVVLHVLPRHIYDRTAIAAAADRMYRDRIKGAWNSLRYNSFPIQRGGGRKALAYSQWLVENGWSLLIFPEGQRSRTGELLPLHVGPAFLALSLGAPVLPIHIHGARDILPAGEKWARPAAVRARIGPLLRFPSGTSPAEAKDQMEGALRALATAAA